MLREFHRRGRLTVTQVVQWTGLSRRTAEAVLNDLVWDGLIEDEPPPLVARGVGRPARTFRFRTDAGLAMGVDVDTRSVRAMLTDLSGTVLGTGDVPVAPATRRGERLDAIRAAAGQAMAESGYG